MKRLLTLLLAIIIPFTTIGGAVADTLRLPKSMKQIDEESFAYAASVEEVDVPLGTETIGSRAFAGSGLKRIYLPSTVRFIAPDAFDEGDLTIVTPDGTYAKAFADEHGFAWEDGSAHYKRDTLEATEALWKTEIEGSLMLERVEIPLLSTESITDKAQLAAYNAINQELLDYEELERQYSTNIDALTDALSSLADELAGVSITEGEDQISIDLGGARYTLSGDAMGSIGSDYEIVSSEQTEDGSGVITEVTSGGQTYYMISSDSGTIVSSSRNGEIGTKSRMLVRGGTASTLIDAVQDFLNNLQYLTFPIDKYIENAWRDAEALVERETQALIDVYDINRKYDLPDEFLAEYENRLHAARKRLDGVMRADNIWRSLGIAGDISGILSDIAKFNKLSEIAAHGHPIPGIAADDRRMTLIQEMNNHILSAQWMYAYDAALNLLSLVGAVACAVTTISQLIPPLAGMVLSLQVLYNMTQVAFTMWIAQIISSLKSDADYNAVMEADNQLHSFVYGYIKDEETKEPVPKVGVTNGSVAVISDENGYYRIHLFPGESHSLVFRAEGYEKNGVVVSLNPRQELQQDIELKPEPDGAKVFGDVTSKETGALLEGVQVTCADRELTTGADGSFCMEGIEPGRYEISFYKVGYAHWSETFTLEEDQQLELNIALDDCYIITTREELEAVANDVMGNYTLGASIDLGEEPWTPLPWFSGTFDGAGCSIDGMQITDAAGDYVGLFAGLNDGHVYNLNMSGVNVDISSQANFMGVGSICGSLSNGASLTNCMVTGTVRATSTSSNENLIMGGLAGFSNHGYITDCFTNVKITAVTPNNVNAGGLTGKLNTGEARDCNAGGNVAVIQSGSNSGASLNAFGTLYSADALAVNCNAAGIITANSTSGNAFAYGVATGKNSVNLADVSASTDDGNASACGYQSGENGVNSGKVLASASGTGSATAIGIDNVINGNNEASVTARASSGGALAYGCLHAGNNATNTGSVIASSTSGIANACGLEGQGSGCTNSGSVSSNSATNQSLAVGMHGCSSSQNNGDVIAVSSKGTAIGQGMTACADSTNYGNVNVTYEGVDNKKGGLSAHGLSNCTNSTNIGSVTGTVKASITSCTVTGAADGSGNVNNGAVTATSQTGPASARGVRCSNSQNYGTIYAYTNVETGGPEDSSTVDCNATAYGVYSGSTDSFNGGQVTAVSENTAAYAYGTDGSGGCTSSGAVSATANYFITGTTAEGIPWGAMGKAGAYNSTSVEATVAGHSVSAADGKTVNLYYFYASASCNKHSGMERRFVSYEQGKEPEDFDGCFCHCGVADSDAA